MGEGQEDLSLIPERPVKSPLKEEESYSIKVGELPNSERFSQRLTVFDQLVEEAKKHLVESQEEVSEPAEEEPFIIQVFNDVLNRNGWSSEDLDRIGEERLKQGFERIIKEIPFKKRASLQAKGSISYLRQRKKEALLVDPLAGQISKLETEDSSYLPPFLPKEFDQDLKEADLLPFLRQAFSDEDSSFKLRRERLGLAQEQLTSLQKEINKQFANSRPSFDNFKAWFRVHSDHRRQQWRIISLGLTLKNDQKRFQARVLDGVMDSAKLLFLGEVREAFSLDPESMPKTDNLAHEFSENFLRQWVEARSYPPEPHQTQADLEVWLAEVRVREQADNPQGFVRIIQLLETKSLKDKFQIFRDRLQPTLTNFGMDDEKSSEQLERFKSTRVPLELEKSKLERFTDFSSLDGLASSIIETNDLKRWAVLRKDPEIRKRYSPEFIDSLDQRMFELVQMEAITKFDDLPIDNLACFSQSESIATLLLLSIGRRRKYSWEHAVPALKTHVFDKETMANFAAAYPQVKGIEDLAKGIEFADYRFLGRETIAKAADFLVNIAGDKSKDLHLRRLALEGLRHKQIPPEKSSLVWRAEYALSSSMVEKISILKGIEEKININYDRTSMENLFYFYDLEKDEDMKGKLALFLESTTGSAQRYVQSDYSYGGPGNKENCQWYLKEVKSRFEEDIKTLKFDPEKPYKQAELALGMIRTLKVLGVKTEEADQYLFSFLTHTKIPSEYEGSGGIYYGERNVNFEIFNQFYKLASESPDSASFDELVPLLTVSLEKIRDSFEMKDFYHRLLPRLSELSLKKPIPAEISALVSQITWKAFKPSADFPKEKGEEFAPTLKSFLKVLYEHKLATVSLNNLRIDDLPLLFNSNLFLHLVGEPERALLTLSSLEKAALAGPLDSQSLSRLLFREMFNNSGIFEIKRGAIDDLFLQFTSKSDEGLVVELIDIYQNETNHEFKNIIISHLINIHNVILKPNFNFSVQLGEKTVLIKDQVNPKIRQVLTHCLTNYQKEFMGAKNTLDKLLVMQRTSLLINHFTALREPLFGSKEILIDILGKIDSISYQSEKETAVYKNLEGILLPAFKDLIGLEISRQNIRELPKLLDFYCQKAPVNEVFSIFQQVLPVFDKKIREGRPLSQGLTDPFLRSFRREDLILPEEARARIPEETFQRFLPAVEKLAQAVSSEGPIYNFKNEILSLDALRFICRQPERAAEIIELPRKVPKLFDYMETGALKNVKGPVLKWILSNGDVIGRARVFENAFSKKAPLWVQLFIFTESVIGPELATSTSTYPIRTIPKIKIPKGIGASYITREDTGEKEIDLLSHHTIIHRDIASMSVRGKRAMVADNFSGLSDERVAAITEIPFNDFKGVVKKVIWLDRLRQSIEFSRDEARKAEADKRNLKNSPDKLVFKVGTYIHGAPLFSTGANVLDHILISGNLPVEALGEKVGKDSYPFHVDFSIFTEQEIAAHSTTADLITNSISNGYGDKGDLGLNGQLLFVYNRGENSFDEGITSDTGNKSHGLIFGGVPSTDISAIVLRNAQADDLKGEKVLEIVKRSIIENGFYIPIYSLDGTLLFKADEFNQVFKDRNLQLPVEIIDSSYKIGEKLGSNPGGVYLIPGVEETEKSYVKYAIPEAGEDYWEAQSRAWNEYLADRIYREMGVLVPPTRVVKIRELNMFGHVSSWIEGERDEHISKESNYRSGAAVDMLLANWDVGFERNLMSLADRVYRVDNGGSLLFLARGERRTSFGPVVTEIDTMWSAYPGLSEIEMKNQVVELKLKLTDEKIDQLVNSVQLSETDRDFLKRTLRERRDYLYSYFIKEAKKPEEIVVPEKGEQIQKLIEGMAVSQVELSTEVPESLKIFSDEGYQHNGQHLGKHTEKVVTEILQNPEFKNLSLEEQNLALMAGFFHDSGKPTGKRGEVVSRDFDHEVPSASLAAKYLKMWGYSDRSIQIVVKIILNDGVVSDIARGKVREETKKYSPEQFAKLIGSQRILEILRIVNGADVIGTVGEDGFTAIREKYESFFSQTREFLS
ncbi:hypothetical protein COT75_03655 [Candidatus Beckwithbacteria bacterium CG10_big_fil_rev_8_21_14_0_10_34_10]|uniref:Uncharacterized protein n=1 Tax=Candidatus Beckwithbacteria bacterium CG10_big_fil_rev_8_21_14_0_10_34_10 TaxID=1974495 RepID=A0A2H0W8Q3_9BACT|nr:MAG: hypothetical protein COT75_03655 [Candidatus Beckwithbacteria bacterium CG10_big_fil_rev_8_21_14_0_10_34_10]